MEITEEESCSSYPPCVPTNKTSRSDEWIWHYFTIYNGEFIKCDICFDVFNPDIKHSLKIHMRSQHLAIYNNSETKWTHSKIDHKYKCNYCDNTYEPIYRTDYLINHIINSHKLNKEIANKLQTWVIDQFIIPKCEICKQFSKYHAFIFMIHLKEVHDVIVPQEFIPQRLSIRLKNLFDPCKNVENIPTSTSNNHQQPSIIRTYFKDYDPTFHSSDTFDNDRTSRSRDSWSWHYFTTYNGEFIKCDICFDVFNHDITQGLKIHMRSQHSAIYNNSETKWTHSKIDHKFKCNYCDNTYEPAYRTDNMIKHIKNSHKLNKEIANKLQTWVIDQFIIPKCEICKQFNKYHAFIFMIHLKEVHDVIVPQEFIPQRLSIRLKNLFDPCKNVENIPTSTSNNHQQPSIIRTYFKDYDPTFHSSDTFETSRSDEWIWHYFTIYNGEFIKCDICFNVFNHDIKRSLKIHMKSKHLAIYNNSETKWTHSEIDHKYKCNYCDNTYEPIYRTDRMINHIINSHKLNKEIANKLQTWVIDQFIIPKCEICKQFSKYHAFIFMIHLKEVHDVIVPQEFIPQRLSIKLKNLFDPCKNVENIPTSTSNNHQQPFIIRTYFKDYDPTFHSSDTFETSRSRDSWSWHYFTIYNGEFIKCAICFDVFNHDITQGLKIHMRSQHSAIYNNSETKWTHSKIDHKLKCNYCDNTYEPAYRTDNMIKHIKNSHKLNKEIANKLQTWVIDQFIIPKCEICKQFSKYHAFIFMIHLKEVHDVIVPQEFIPQRLSFRLKNLFDPCKNVENIPTSTSNNHQQPSILRTYFKDYDPTFHSSDTFETSRSDEWIWHYFTIYNGEFIKCDICFDVFNPDIKHSLKIHMRSQHLAIYNNSETKWTHSKIDHKYKCNYCDNTYEPIYRTDYLINHIINSHKLNKEIANKLQTWVIDQFIIPKCEICKQFSKYHAFIFMIHLKKVHDVIVPQEFIPQRLSIRLKNLFDPCKNVENIPTSTSNNHQQPSIIRTYFKDYDPTFHSSDTFDNETSRSRDSWSWHYFTIYNGEFIKCDICFDVFNHDITQGLKIHMRSQHSAIYNNSETKWTHSKIDHKLKCHYCDNTYEPVYRTDNMIKHIKNSHKLNKEIANKLQTWVIDQFIIPKCEICKQFSKYHAFIFMIHLKEVHDVIVPQEFIPQRLSIRLKNLFDPCKNVENIPTSTSNNHQQPSIIRTYFKDYDPTFISSDTFELSHTSSNLLSSGNDTATSSSFYQSIVS
ncbi:uncharacterized protein LOC114929171 isoform X2 [Nylanderia fulva]|uniref:uncharacterized protein LOC114929171 isoform X2 n=1 Tax=Nylanderia fulva TaxID=613905 RepID=UPI0010FB849D|nr:uncharacterized protein LOC114929171 isoform X2 [Nylanderia fulva]